MPAKKKPVVEAYIPLPPEPEIPARNRAIWGEVARRLHGGFFHVRSASGAPHEFDVPVHAYERHPERYVLLDTTPVEQTRPAVMVAGATAPENNDAPDKGNSEEESNGK